MYRNLTKFSLLGLLLLMGWALQAQTKVSGTVKDASTNEALIGANIVINGTSVGSTSDANGAFEFETAFKPPFTVRCTYIGYASKDVLVTEGSATQVDIVLGQITSLTDEIVVSASRRAEKVTEAPSTINIITAKQIDETPSFNIGELAARQKGVDYVRAGVLGTGLNVRGFNSAFNPKNLQMNDNRISTLIATGLPFGSLGTVVKEDIERVEIILGPSSALYGPNANNGLVNTITKNPRSYPGTTVVFGAGNQGVLSTRLRHAQVINDKWAFKITGEYTRGTEFDYTDTVYIGSNPLSALAKTELDLNRDFNNLRGEASVYYSPKKGRDLIFSYGGSNSNNLAQTNAGRNQIKDWQIQYYQVRYSSPRFFAQAYYTTSKTDSTYAINQMTQNYWSYKLAGFSEDTARMNMLKFQWFPLSATNPKVGLNLKRGALFQDKSNRLNGEAQYNNNFKGYNFIAGVQYQRDFANSNNTYLLDNNGAGITINQLGGYVQIEKTFAEKLKAVVAARADNHDLYGFNFIPKAALVYLMPHGALRATYGQGVAAPTILNLEANIFGGVLLGNGQGYTLRDYNVNTRQVTETVIDPLKVEKVQTLELGYKGTIGKKLFIDANAYYNKSSNFISPSINIAAGAPAGIRRTVLKRGDVLMRDVVQGTPDTGAALVLTYVNFGEVATGGFDIGFNYYLNSKLSLALNYSYFDYKLDTADRANDGDRNGIVTQLDLPINTPKHKGSLAINYSDGKFFGSVFTRWVQAYDFFSGINVAAKSNPDIYTTLAVPGTSPTQFVRYTLEENKRFGRYFNNGPLGGFVNVDISAGYRINKIFTVGGQIVNVFDSRVREFVAAPSIGRMYQVELKVNLPALTAKK